MMRVYLESKPNGMPLERDVMQVYVLSEPCGMRLE